MLCGVTNRCATNRQIVYRIASNQAWGQGMGKACSGRQMQWVRVMGGWVGGFEGRRTSDWLSARCAPSAAGVAGGVGARLGLRGAGARGLSRRLGRSEAIPATAAATLGLPSRGRVWVADWWLELLHQRARLAALLLPPTAPRHPTHLGSSLGSGLTSGEADAARGALGLQAGGAGGWQKVHISVERGGSKGSRAGSLSASPHLGLSLGLHRRAGHRGGRRGSLGERIDGLCRRPVHWPNPSCLARLAHAPCSAPWTCSHRHHHRHHQSSLRRAGQGREGGAGEHSARIAACAPTPSHACSHLALASASACE